MLTRKQKEVIVQDVKQKVQDAKSVVFVDYKGLGVSDTQELKKQLRSEGVEYQVLKKKLFLRAAKDAGLEVESALLEGQFSVAYSLQDEVSAAKIIDSFAKGRGDIRILGGVLEGNVIQAENVKALAKLPSREELLAKMVGSIKAPISGFVNVLSGNTRSFVQVLKAISESKS